MKTTKEEAKALVTRLESEIKINKRLIDDSQYYDSEKVKKAVNVLYKEIEKMETLKQHLIEDFGI